jgi:hypothetical protein
MIFKKLVFFVREDVQVFSVQYNKKIEYLIEIEYVGYEFSEMKKYIFMYFLRIQRRSLFTKQYCFIRALTITLCHCFLVKLSLSREPKGDYQLEVLLLLY